MTFNIQYAEAESMAECNPQYLSATNMEYVKNLAEATQSIQNYRALIANDSNFPFSKKHKGCFVPIQSVLQILSQTGEENELITGLKIYFGKSLNEVDDDGMPLLELIIIATASGIDNSIATDFHVLDIEGQASEPLIAAGRPCPKQCGGENILNRDV